MSYLKISKRHVSGSQCGNWLISVMSCACVFSSFIHDANCLNWSYQVVCRHKSNYSNGFGTLACIWRPNYIWTHQVYIIHSKQSTAPHYAHVNCKWLPWMQRNYTQTSPLCETEPSGGKKCVDAASSNGGLRFNWMQVNTFILETVTEEKGGQK